MNLRKSNPNDEEGIAKVLVESYNIKDLEEGKKAFLSERLKGHNYIVAEDNGIIIGLTTWLTHGLPKHGLAELDRIAVLPEFQGKGVAKKLFKKLVDESGEFYKKNKSRLRKLYLLTHDNNERAKKFYEKIGFTHETTLKKHYYDDKDEFVYSIFF